MLTEPSDDTMRAWLVWMLELDAYLDEWAIPDPTNKDEESNDAG